MWKNEVSSVFEKFLQSLNDGERERIHTLLMALKERGPFLSRPHCDTIKCTKISNLKELRVNCKANPIRVLFAFDSDSVGYAASTILSGSASINLAG